MNRLNNQLINYFDLFDYCYKTTNLVERSIRPFAIHRRAWLFVDTPVEAVCNTVIYSLVESAGINNLNIFKYIECFLAEFPQIENPTDEEQLKQYLPRKGLKFLILGNLCYMLSVL